MRNSSGGGFFQLLMKRKKTVAVLIIIIGALFAGFFFAKDNKKILALKSITTLGKLSAFLPVSHDEQQEIQVIGKLTDAFTKNDGTTRTFLFLLQNNMELRPGGGFLGQYAIIKIKDGAVVSSYFEDANLLDQRIKAKITPPYPFKRMMQLSNWKFRDSNFSPDFPTNVEKAEYFYRLSGGNPDFDGVIAVNSQAFNDVLAITGPVTVPGYNVEFNSTDGFLKLEEVVEKAYIMNPDIDTQNRKAIMKNLTTILIQKLSNIGSISKLGDFVHKEFQQKNVMVNFKDAELQKLVESVHWDGEVTKDWGSDFLMCVDANMGALKTDYYMRRQINYDIDLTAEKPTVTLNILYRNTAPQGDWRTSDYHSYLRVYAPKGSNFIESKMASHANTADEFNKTYFGFIVHVLIGGETNVIIKYELPADFNKDDYRLLIQKQSGVGDVPVHVHLKTANGEFDQDQTMTQDLKFQFQENTQQQ